MTVRFEAASPYDLIIHELDDMNLIYHRPSAITHIVVDLIPAILQVMAAGRYTVTDIAQKLAVDFDVDSDADIELAIAARLEEMYTLGLVEKFTA